ncbi:MAG: hypothetical protein Q4P33_06365 [Flaviflexus sp.]|nr:hypothetical protein [Flaviflexus sp.]
MLTCHKCFTKFNLPDLLPSCGRPGCTVDPQTQAELRARAGGVLADVQTQMKQVADEHGRLFWQCPQCGGTDQGVRRCRRCGDDIEPLAKDPVETFTIALTGARSAGKTVYMVALVETLDRFAKMHDGRLTEQGHTKTIYRDTYYKRVFADGQVLDPTPPGRQQSLHYRLEGGPRPVDIIISDVGGETLQNTYEATPDLDYINNADLVICLFDPYKVETIRTALNGIVDMRQDVGHEADRIIDTLTDYLIHKDNYHTNFALLFGKFDLVRHLHKAHNSVLPRLLANLGSSFFTDDTFTPGYRWSEEESRIHDEDVRSLFHLLTNGEALRASEIAFENRPDQLRTFAVSALGDAPGGNFLSRVGVTPFRCLDPVQWAYRRVYGRGLMED